MRTKTVTVNGKDIVIHEHRISELEKTVEEMFPGSGGSIAKIDISKALEKVDFDLLREKLPVLFPQIKASDVADLYPSDIEALLEAWIDVHFFGLKRMIRPLMSLVQAGSIPKQ